MVTGESQFDVGTHETIANGGEMHNGGETLTCKCYDASDFIAVTHTLSDSSAALYDVASS